MHLQLVENIKYLVIDFPAQETNVFCAGCKATLFGNMLTLKSVNPRGFMDLFNSTFLLRKL